MSETSPMGFDVATVLTGSGVTLLISAGIVTFADRFRFTVPEMYAMAGVALILLGVLFGLVVVTFR